MRTEKFPGLTVAAERELVARIEEEIQRRIRESDPIPGLPTDLPGDPLVVLAGELALSVSAQALQSYQGTLWPRIRQALPLPESLVAGSYQWAIAETERLASAEIKPFALAAASSSDNASCAVSIFAMRLDAGFFLAGLKSLWPRQAPLFTRRLWHVCGLGRWDDLLQAAHSLRSYSAVLRRLVADSPARLDPDCFGSLLDLMAEKVSLSIVATRKADSQPAPDSGSLRPWQVFLVQDLLLELYPEEMETGKIAMVQDDPSGMTLIQDTTKGRLYGVWFADGRNGHAETLTLRLEDAVAEQLHHRVAALWILETFAERHQEDSLDWPEDGEDLWSIPVRFKGLVNSRAMAPMKCSEPGMAVFEVETKQIEPLFDGFAC